VALCGAARGNDEVIDLPKRVKVFSGQITTPNFYGVVVAAGTAMRGGVKVPPNAPSSRASSRTGVTRLFS
jgi:hypothetical protein